MVYQGKPSAGCQNCRKRKIKVRTCTGRLMEAIRSRPPTPVSVSPLHSAMKPSPPALNVSTPKGNALGTFPASTSSYATKLRQSAERPNARSSSRMKGQSFPHRLSRHLQRTPPQRHGPLSTPVETLPVRLRSVIHPMNLSQGCSTTFPSNKPSVPSSSISYFSLAIPTVSKAISSTYYLCTPTPLLNRLCP